MAIQNDFTIYPKTKVIRHTSGTTVYSAVAFYSYLMTTFDEPGFLTYQTPIKFNTPTSFTMLNGWFLDDGDGNTGDSEDGHILQYLTGGGIDTSGYSTISDPILMADLQTSTADFVYTDKDRTVKSGANVGPLLAYKNDYPTAGRIRIWVRDTQSHGALATATVTEVTTAGGTGSGTTDSVTGSVSGDEIYHNLFTIASFPTDVFPQVYVYQRHPVTTQSYNVRVRIAEWSAFTNWDRGSIDVLIPVKLGGTLIDSGNVSVFVRQTGDTYTFVENTGSSALNPSGRTPNATETSADEVNITKGEHYLLFDGSDAGSFVVDDVITDTDVGAGIPPTWYAEVAAVTFFSGNASGVLTFRSLRGDITDNDNIYVTVYSASQAVSVLEGVANGTPGDTYTTNSAVSVELTVGLTCTGGTSGAKRVLKGLDLAGDAYVFADNTAITGGNRDAYYKDFSASETITDTGSGSITHAATTSTTIISGYNDITVAHVNGTVTVSGIANGPLILGDKFTYNAGAQSGILIYADSLSAPTTLTLGNIDSANEPDASDVFAFQLAGAGTCTVNSDSGLTDTNTQNFNFTLQSFTDPNGLYSVFIEGGSIYNTGRSLSDIYAYLQFYLRDGQPSSSRVIYTSTGSAIVQLAAEEYIKADSDYSASKSAPFGTLAGSTFFGAQAVWIQGMQTSDNNNIKLTDSGGTLRQPFTSVNITIKDNEIGDRIAVYLEAGTTELPNKTQYTSHATLNDIGDATFDTVDGTTFPNDTPTSGTFIVVDTSASEEHRYRYTSFNNTSGTGDDGQLVLPAGVTGTVTTGGNQTFTASGSDFVSAGILIGDIILRTNNEGGWSYVTLRNSATVLTTTLFYGGITAPWDHTATADTFELLNLVVDYEAADTFFIPYVDTRATDTNDIVVTLTYVADREVVIEARNVEVDTQIVPFKTTGQILSTGLTQSIIRVEDTVYT